MDFNDVIQRNKKYKFQNYQKAVCFKDVPLDHVANETEMRNRCVALLHQRHNFFKYQSHTTTSVRFILYSYISYIGLGIYIENR